MTRARVHTELLDDTPERRALLRDLGEMRDLITTLLESERLAQGHQALHAEPTDLAALPREVVAAQSLQDHGPGVPADVLPQLEQAFYRPDAARTRSSGGVGLGLHLCHLVARAHSGELRVRQGQATPGLDVAMVWPAIHG